LGFFATQNVVALALTQPDSSQTPPPLSAPGAATSVLSVLDGGDPRPVSAWDWNAFFLLSILIIFRGE